MLKASLLLIKFEFMYIVSHNYLRVGEYYNKKAWKHINDDDWANYMKLSLDYLNRCATIQARMDELRHRIEEIVGME